MKRFALILGVGLALLAAPSLTACGSLADAATSVTSSSPAQANTLAAAELTYTAVAKVAKVYLQSGTASPATAKSIGDLDNQVYAALLAARQAQSSGNSPAIAAALQVFNTKYGSLWGFLKGLGLPVPG
jgi:hypothetical protein